VKKESKLTYKQLYEIELNNRKMYEQRYKEVIEENYKLQQGTGVAEIRKENNELKDKIFDLNVQLCEIKEDRAKLYIQLEDLRNEKELEVFKESNNGE